jgi:hypothetical protein
VKDLLEPGRVVFMVLVENPWLNLPILILLLLAARILLRK